MEKMNMKFSEFCSSVLEEYRDGRVNSYLMQQYLNMMIRSAKEYEEKFGI